MKRKMMWFWAIVMVVVTGAAGTSGFGLWAGGDGVQEGKVYQITASYGVDNDLARQFDFKDRNVASGSITVLTNHGSIKTVVYDSQLPLSTVVKRRIHVPKKVREGSVQPAYDYIEWRWNAAVLEVQLTSPDVIPRKGK